MPGIILINPEVFQDSRDAMAVCVNEALRLFMEDIRFKPDFEPTPEQQKFFRGTAYADNPDALKKTILARVATFDTSVSPTPEETSETRRLLSLVMEAIGKKHQDYPLMKRLHDQVGKARLKAPAAPASIVKPGTEQDDELGGEVAVPTALRMTLGSPASVPGPARVMPPKPTYLDPIRINPMETPTVTLVPAPQPVPDKARTIDRVVDILSDIESKNNPGAIGDQGRAEGLLQMWKIQVDEANRLAGKTKWTYQDRKDPEKSKAMAREFLSHKFDKGVTNPIQLAGMWRNPRGNAPLWYLDKAREAQIGLEE